MVILLEGEVDNCSDLLPLRCVLVTYEEIVVMRRSGQLLCFIFHSFLPIPVVLLLSFPNYRPCIFNEVVNEHWPRAVLVVVRHLIVDSHGKVQ